MSLHRKAGHQGRDRTLSLMKGQFWWPGMATALCSAIQNCGRCKQFEAKCQLPKMEPIVCTQPMELIHMDYIGMEVTMAAKEKPVVKNVLVVVDHFTHYIQAFIMKNHTAHTTARVMYNNFFSIFGFPQKLLSDQGTEFTGDVIAAMCKLLRIEKFRTTPYHPQTNRSAERVHQILQRMIGKLDPEKTPEMARACQIHADRLQCYSVTGNRVLPILFNVRAEVACRPTIPNSEQPRMDPYHQRVCEGSL